VPRTDTVRLPSRHLGLAISPENDYEAVIARAAAHVEKTVAIDRLLAVTTQPAPIAAPSIVAEHAPLHRIAVARDEAFNFTYYENLEALQRLGEVVYFSPIHDHVVPSADLIYLAGGYPELFLEKLASTTSLISSLRAHANAGGRVLAECGGLMYLGRHIVDVSGRRHAMADLLPLETSMQNARLALGYRTVALPGRILRGHEFHFSTLSELEPLTSVARVTDTRGHEVATKIYRQHNIVTSYIHFYWGEDQGLLAF
jgi:cobyrinic acid a,c-diamide synthase